MWGWALGRCESGKAGFDTSLENQSVAPHSRKSLLNETAIYSNIDDKIYSNIDDKIYSHIDDKICSNIDDNKICSNIDDKICSNIDDKIL